MQALELYHRLTYNNTVFSKDEFPARKKAILCGAPKEYRHWLADQLAYSNEPRLVQRPDELFGLTEDIMGQFYKDRRTFNRRVDTRNYYVHYNASLVNKAARGSDLYWLTQALSYMLIRCLLAELGFSPEQCVEIFKKSYEFSYTKHQLNPGNSDY